MTLQLYSFARNSLKYITRCCFMFASIKFLFILLISQKDVVTSQPAVLFLSMAQQSNSNLGWLVVDVFRSHTHTHTPSDSCERAISWSPKAVTDAALKRAKDRPFMLSAGFDRTIPAIKRLQSYAFSRPATRIAQVFYMQTGKSNKIKRVLKFRMISNW